MKFISQKKECPLPLIANTLKYVVKRDEGRKRGRGRKISECFGKLWEAEERKRTKTGEEWSERRACWRKSRKELPGRGSPTWFS